MRLRKTSVLPSTVWVAMAAIQLLAACGSHRDGHKHPDKQGKKSGKLEKKPGHAERGHGDHGHGSKDSKKKAPAGEVRLSKAAVLRNGIRVAVVESASLTGGVDAPAEVRLHPDLTAHVVPLVPGQLAKVTAQLGQRVKKGQVLARLRSVDIGQARATVSGAWAGVQAAQTTFKRKKRLLKEGVGSKRAYLDAKAALRRAQARLWAASARLRVYTKGRGSGSVAPIRSPLSGVVVERHATPGEVVGTSKPIFVVADLRRIWVIGRVYEQDVAVVRRGAAAEVRLYAYPGRSWPGKIDYVASRLDERTRTLGIRVALKNPGGLLRPGLFGSISFSPPGRAGKSGPVIPDAAVQRFKGGHIVFVPRHAAGEYRAVPVVLGRRIRGRVEVRSGLRAGAKVVVKGTFTLKSQLLRSELGEGHAH